MQLKYLFPFHSLYIWYNFFFVYINILIFSLFPRSRMTSEQNQRKQSGELIA